MGGRRALLLGGIIALGVGVPVWLVLVRVGTGGLAVIVVPALVGISAGAAVAYVSGG